MANLPEMRRIASDAVEVVFMPKAIARQVALAIVLETGAVRTVFQLSFCWV